MNKDNQIKIIHTADIQVKVRDKNLTDAYIQSLEYIKQSLIDTEANIYVIAGDLFEFATPNDAERKIMYAHLGAVLSISTLSEVVIMAGNHDLISDKKQIDSNRGSNAVDTFAEFLRYLDAEAAEKITYLKHQKQYLSKFDKRLGWIAYSLEDGTSAGSNLKPETFAPTSINICIYHDILREYIDDAGLPVKKENYKKYISVNDFASDLILAGDIHVNYSKNSIDGKKFFMYPGSPIQRDHSEGSFLKIRKNQIAQKAAQKVIKFITIDLDAKKDSTNVLTYVVADIIIPDTISYITFDFNTNFVVSDFQPIFENLVENIIFGSKNTFVKVKLSNAYIAHELYIYKTLSTYAATKNQHININIIYDKFVILNATGDGHIINLDDDTVNDIAEEKFDFESLVLDNEKLASLFGNVLDTQVTVLKKEIEDEMLDEVLVSIKELFADQLVLSLLSNPTYNIDLKSIETNGFMNLGANKINLDIPGLTRITGTNGVGKTTLYTMLRWVIDDEVLEGMSKKTKTRNTLHIFNNKLIENDNVIVRLITEINSTSVVITRKASRVWKTNTPDADKASKGWKNHISSINKEITLQVFKDGQLSKTLTGDEADATIKKWFGTVSSTIMILNQQKILNMLNLPSQELKQLVLDYIGVDYLNKLEANLPQVKEQFNLQKPKLSKIELELQLKKLLETKQLLETGIIEKQETYDNTIIVNKESEELRNQIHDKLLNIGNIPEIIKTVENKIVELKTEKSLLKIEDKKILPIFKEIAPKEIKFDDAILEISNIEKEIVVDTEAIKTQSTLIVNNFNELIVNLTKTNNDIKLLNDVKYSELKLKFEEQQKIDKIKNSEQFKVVENLLTDIHAKLEAKLITDTNNLNELTNNITINEKLILDLTEEIASGVCSKCIRPFETDKTKFEEHKVELTSKIEQFKKQIEQSKLEITPISEGLVKVKTFVANYNLYVNYAKDQNIEFFKTNKDSINSSVHESLTALILLHIIEQANLLIYKAIVNQDSVYLISHNYLTNDESVNFVNNYAEIVKNEEYIQKAKNSDLEFFFGENIKTSPDNGLLLQISRNTELLITDLNAKLVQKGFDLHTKKSELENNRNTYITTLQKYQTALQLHTTETAEITKFNQEIDVLNTKILNIDNTIIGLIERNVENTSQLPLYNDLVNEKDNINILISEQVLLINSLREEINNNDRLKLTNKMEINTIESSITEYLTWQKNTVIYKIYEKLIKKDFKDIVFSYYRNYLNNTLNILLEDLAFKLYWDEEGDLFMVRIENGNMSFGPVQLVSGMETCFQGLSLIYVIHLLNVKNNISNIFIDEISGQLNSGEELTQKDNIVDYQAQLILLLNKFTEKKLYIVDHVIQNMFETGTYEVVKGEKGSKFILLD